MTIETILLLVFAMVIVAWLLMVTRKRLANIIGRYPKVGKMLAGILIACLLLLTATPFIVILGSYR